MNFYTYSITNDFFKFSNDAKLFEVDQKEDRIAIVFNGKDFQVHLFDYKFIRNFFPVEYRENGQIKLTLFKPEIKLPQLCLLTLENLIIEVKWFISDFEQYLIVLTHEGSISIYHHQSNHKLTNGKKKKSKNTEIHTQSENWTVLISACINEHISFCSLLFKPQSADVYVISSSSCLMKVCFNIGKKISYGITYNTSFDIGYRIQAICLSRDGKYIYCYSTSKDLLIISIEKEPSYEIVCQLSYSNLIMGKCIDSTFRQDDFLNKKLFNEFTKDQLEALNEVVDNTAELLESEVCLFEHFTACFTPDGNFNVISCFNYKNKRKFLFSFDHKLFISNLKKDRENGKSVSGNNQKWQKDLSFRLVVISDKIISVTVPKSSFLRPKETGMSLKKLMESDIDDFTLSNYILISTEDKLIIYDLECCKIVAMHYFIKLETSGSVLRWQHKNTILLSSEKNALCVVKYSKEIDILGFPCDD